MSKSNAPRGMVPAQINRPSFESLQALKLVEFPPTDADQRRFLNSRNSYFRRYALGECSILVTKEEGRWHLSIAHPRRYPTWDEIAEARYRIIPDSVYVVMVLPPRREYINVHNYCFQLHESLSLEDQDLILNPGAYVLRPGVHSDA